MIPVIFSQYNFITSKSQIIIEVVTDNYTEFYTLIELSFKCQIAQQCIRVRGGNSQNFLHKFVRFFLTLKCFYRVDIHRKQTLYDLYSS